MKELDEFGYPIISENPALCRAVLEACADVRKTHHLYIAVQRAAIRYGFAPELILRKMRERQAAGQRLKHFRKKIVPQISSEVERVQWPEPKKEAIREQLRKLDERKIIPLFPEGE